MLTVKEEEAQSFREVTLEKQSEEEEEWTQVSLEEERFMIFSFWSTLAGNKGNE